MGTVWHTEGTQEKQLNRLQVSELGQRRGLAVFSLSSVT